MIPHAGVPRRPGLGSEELADTPPQRGHVAVDGEQVGAGRSSD
ncbi:MAG: hypothetical protein ACR2FV_01355 [Ornithinimicrobium sp.]